LRDRRVACPASCPHRERHQPYQDRRAAERPAASAGPAGDDPLRDERLSWLALHAEAPLLERARAHPDFTDADAVAALEYAREKAAKGSGLIVIPGRDQGPINEAGEAVRRGLDGCRYEPSVLLTGAREGYTGDEKIRILDRLLPAARSFARQSPGDRTYLERIAAQFAALDAEQGKNRILAPR
jgi:hypothetical protein